MPELPEVESVARRLAPRLRGRTLLRVELLDPRLQQTDPRPALGHPVATVRRLGKQIAVRFHHPDRITLLCHLRMTGRLVWLADGETPPETRHLRARLHFDQGLLLFLDPRRFGTLRFLPENCTAPTPGLEPLSRRCTPDRLARLLAHSRQELKPWLLRQDRLAGIGNIYASEIAFHARLHPRRLAGSLRPAEIRRLHHAVQSVLRHAIRLGGTTFSDFADPAGRPGRFARELAVYGRLGRPCPHCGTAIVRFTQQQRSTYACPHCQPQRPPGTDVATRTARDTAGRCAKGRKDAEHPKRDPDR